MINIKIPAVGESITEVTLVKWMVNDGDYVVRDQVLCEMESEKATFELNAEQSGIIHTKGKAGENLKIGDIACTIDETAAAPEKAADAPKADVKAPKEAPKAAASQQVAASQQPAPVAETKVSPAKATPVAQAIITDKHVDSNGIKGTGSLGRIVKNDVLEALAKPSAKAGNEATARNENVQKMSNLRKTVARRLVEAKNSTAMLTTFNEVDMTRIMDVRKQYKDKFKETHGINLGFMSFFAKACSIALTEWPSINAYLDSDTIIFHEYCDISIAVSAPKGLVVPVIRNAESLSIAELEQAVAALAQKARDNKLTPDEMSGGTFTITNGGVFGSLMSTPIINIPQSAILGMHKIQDRPMAINGKVEIRPMMYLALSYDHRIVDGRESVSFLVRVKELLENPDFLILGYDPVKALLGIK